MKKLLLFLLVPCFFLLGPQPVEAYPIDGYVLTGIKRLVRLQRIISGELKDTKPVAGAQWSVDSIKLNLTGQMTSEVLLLPETDNWLQQQVNSLFPRLDESYSVAIMEITPGKKMRYAQRQEKRGFQPGSVGKLAVITGLFCELENIFPGDFEKRRDLMKTRMVKAGPFGVYDSHTVPFYDPETGKFSKRQVVESDVFSLYEWTDHMLSVSNNGAASIVWREAMLMHVFGEEYLTLTQEAANAWLKATPRAELADIAINVVNGPLRDLGITEDEWKLGLMFTRGASNIVPGKGGSIGSPAGMMKWLIALESGHLIDEQSSLEIKRLMYMTDRRIRYATAKSLDNAAVYFKSGSLYKCREEEGYACGKYKGNVHNYMNSVAIIEHGDSLRYMVALMSNVLRKNSANDHMALASQIDKIMMKPHE